MIRATASTTYKTTLMAFLIRRPFTLQNTLRIPRSLPNPISTLISIPKPIAYNFPAKQSREASSSSKMDTSHPIKSTYTLNNGIEIPSIHLGVYLTNGDVTKKMVKFALEAGYKAIDSAEWYENEAEVGSSVTAYLKSNNAKRSDIWFTTKLKTNTSYNATRAAIKRSIKTSGLEYLDLYLLHSPYGGKEKRLECWRAVEDAIDDGEVRAGGVSNYGVKHLRELLDSNPRIQPAVNQIEVHPFNTRTDITSFCATHNIAVQAYAPLAAGQRMEHPTILSLKEKYGCTAAQLLVRWSLQHSYIPLPKSVKKARIIANQQVDFFEISKDDMKTLDGCDEYLVTDWDPTDAP